MNIQVYLKNSEKELNEFTEEIYKKYNFDGNNLKKTDLNGLKMFIGN